MGGPCRQGQQQRADTLWELGVGLLPDQGLVAVQQLILKGLYRPETEAITIEVHVCVNPAFAMFSRHVRAE